jgi:hypothetical protein
MSQPQEAASFWCDAAPADKILVFLFTFAKVLKYF